MRTTAARVAVLVAALVATACWLGGAAAYDARVMAPQHQPQQRALPPGDADDSPCKIGADFRRECEFVSDGDQHQYEEELKRMLLPDSSPKSKSPTTKRQLSVTKKAVIHVSSREIGHLDSVALSFEIPGSPHAADWVGAYCVDDETNPSPDSEFLESVTTNNRSSGVLEFKRLPNMRCSWQFRLFRPTDDGKKQLRLAHSPYVRMTSGRFEPLQVHIAMTNNPSEMRVMWTSAPVNSPEVHYGLTPTNFTLSVSATSASYKAKDMCEEPATIESALYYRDPGSLYDALMTGLEPGTTYFYQVGGKLKSQVFQFTVPLPAGSFNPSQPPMSFFVYGDMGDWDMKALGDLPSDRTATTAQLMRLDMDESKDTYDFVAAFHDGDVSYAKGRTYLWDQFMALIQPVAAELPYLVEVGNHDYCYSTPRSGSKDPSGVTDSTIFHPPNAPSDCQSGGECGVPLNKRFHMPDNGNGVFWYSLEMGLMHHTVISTEHDYTPGSPMYTWLVNDLKHVSRSKTPWLFLHIHRPMYCSEMYEQDYHLSQFIRKNLETLCAVYGVDVVFSGHYHAYERTCPVFQEQCMVESLENGLEKAKAPVHIMVGSAGASLDSAGYYQVPWSRAAQMEYGYGRVHVYNVTHALYEFKRNRDRAVADAAWIISDHDWQDEILAKSLSLSASANKGFSGKFVNAGQLGNGDGDSKVMELEIDSDQDLIADGTPAPRGDDQVVVDLAFDQDVELEQEM
ncbi:Inactive purple acid phosphatase 9 [Globisporangium polare]